MSQYQKKHSTTHIHEEEEEGFTQTTRSALSQQMLLDPIKPAYNQSRPVGHGEMLHFFLCMHVVMLGKPIVGEKHI